MWRALHTFSALLFCQVPNALSFQQDYYKGLTNLCISVLLITRAHPFPQCIEGVLVQHAQSQTPLGTHFELVTLKNGTINHLLHIQGIETLYHYYGIGSYLKSKKK